MTDEQLLRELHTGLALARVQQTDINHRLGKIEKALQDEEDAEDAKRSAWWTWAFQTIAQVALVTFLVWIGQQMGVEVAG